MTFDLTAIKARLPEYLEAIGAHIFTRADDRLTAACPIHGGEKPNFDGKRTQAGEWVWICRSGCGGRGGTVIDLHAALRGLSSRSAEAITGTAEVLRLDPETLAPRMPSIRERAALARRQARERAALVQAENQQLLTDNLSEKRRDLVAPFLSEDWRADFFHASPYDLAPGHAGQVRQMLDLLFRPDDLIWMGDTKDSGRPEHAAHFRPASAWLNESTFPPRLSAGTYRADSFSRCHENLVTEPFLIIESDEITGKKPTTDAEREESRQWNAALMNFLMARFHLQLCALIDTGGKSLHGWFAHPGDATKAALARLLDGLAIDSAVFDRASCAPLRAPGCLHQTTGKRASLYYLNTLS